MPVLSLHSTYSLPAGSASYTLGLSGAPGASSYTYPTVGTGALSSLGTSGLTGTSHLSGAGAVGTSAGVNSLIGPMSGINLTSTNPLGSLGLNTTSSYSTYTNPLLTGTTKYKAIDDIDIGIGRYTNRSGTPCSPIPPATWGLDSYSGLDGVNPAFMHSQRPLSRMELECKY